jgi:hypothetical protein
VVEGTPRQIKAVSGGILHLQVARHALRVIGQLYFIKWRGIARIFFSCPLPFFGKPHDLFARIAERRARKCLKTVALLADLRYTRS